MNYLISSSTTDLKKIELKEAVKEQEKSYQYKNTWRFVPVTGCYSDICSLFGLDSYSFESLIKNGLALLPRFGILNLFPVDIRDKILVLVQKILEAELESLVITAVNADASRVLTLPYLELVDARVVKRARQSVAIWRELYFHLFSVKVQTYGIIVELGGLKTLDHLKEAIVVGRLLNGLRK